MRRHLRQNLLLTAAVAALAAIVWFVTAREQASTLAPLTDIDTTRIAAVTVSARGKPIRRFDRHDGRWWMREPYAMPAHKDAVARLLAIAAAPTRSRHARDRFDAARVGLDPPQAVLELDGRRLEFGVTDAIRGDRYVRSGDTLALMPDRFSGWLLAPAESEIDHRLAEPLAHVVQVTIDGRDRPEFAAAWDRVTTSQVVAPETVSGPARSVELADASGRRIAFTVRRRDDGRYVAVRTEPALAYPLDEPQIQQLLPAGGAGSGTVVR